MNIVYTPAAAYCKAGGVWTEKDHTPDAPGMSYVCPSMYIFISGMPYVRCRCIQWDPS